MDGFVTTVRIRKAIGVCSCGARMNRAGRAPDQSRGGDRPFPRLVESGGKTAFRIKGTTSRIWTVQREEDRTTKRLIEAAGVPPIKFHGAQAHLRDVASSRPGSRSTSCPNGSATRKVEITLNIYAHVLPDMQRDAAQRLGSLLYGR